VNLYLQHRPSSASKCSLYERRARAFIDKSCIIPSVSTSLAILGCGQRKRQTSRLVPAIERYDGPTFRVFRKHANEVPRKSTHASILSARFGLIASNFLIPRYNCQFSRTSGDGGALRAKVEDQLKRTLDRLQPGRVFVSVGREYWPLLEDALAREVATASLVIANGGVGGRASQLAHWLRFDDRKTISTQSRYAAGEAVLLGTTVRLNSEEVLERARAALIANPNSAKSFETWYVALDADRVAAKWLASILFCKPVARFRTADAKRVLSLLGINCLYADQH